MRFVHASYHETVKAVLAHIKALSIAILLSRNHPLKTPFGQVVSFEWSRVTKAGGFCIIFCMDASNSSFEISLPHPEKSFISI